MIETLDLKTTIDIDDHVRYVEKAFDLKVDSEMTTRIRFASSTERIIRKHWRNLRRIRQRQVLDLANVWN